MSKTKSEEPAMLRPPMTDHFATLQQSRRPWLDAAALKDTFHRLSAQQHPDTAGGDVDSFAALNAAWQTLREPASRLRHLIELEAPGLLARPVQIPPALADTFMRIAALRRTLEDFRKKLAAASTPLARALLAAEQRTLRSALESALADLAAAHERALAELRALDAAWPASLDALAALQQQLAFLSKWSTDLRESLFILHPSSFILPK